MRPAPAPPAPSTPTKGALSEAPIFAASLTGQERGPQSSQPNQGGEQAYPPQRSQHTLGMAFTLAAKKKKQADEKAEREADAAQAVPPEETIFGGVRPCNRGGTIHCGTGSSKRWNHCRSVTAWLWGLCLLTCYVLEESRSIWAHKRGTPQHVPGEFLRLRS